MKGNCVILGALAFFCPPVFALGEPVIDGGIRIAANFPGNDCGEKIMAANSELGDGPGEIWVDNACGMDWVTEVEVGENKVIRFSQGGVYNVSAPIKLGHLVGSGYGAPHLSGQAPTVIRQADGANLPYVLRIGTHAGSITDVEVDGNMDNNPLAEDGIHVRGRGATLVNVYVHHATRHGIFNNGWTALGDEAGVLKIQKIVSAHNGGDGIHYLDAQDSFVSMSEFEKNGGRGMAFINSNSARIEHSDIAQNDGYGIYATGDMDRMGTRYLVIVGNQFGSGGDTDIYIDGWDGTGYVSAGHLITGNMFYSGTKRAPLVTDAIHLQDSYANTVTGNVFNSNTDHEYRYGVNVSSSGRSLYDTVTGNSFIGLFGEQAIRPSTYTTRIGNTGGHNFLMNDLTVTGALMFGGTSGQTGKPFFKADTGFETSGITGELFGIAEAGVAYHLQMDKSGSLGVAGSLNSAGVVSAGDITPAATDAHDLGAAGNNWGCLYYNSGTLGTCASDGRAKQAVTDLRFADPLRQVEGLRPRRYQFRRDETASTYHGLIAQEVETVAPELVTTSETGDKSVKYGDIQWLLVSALKQLSESFGSLFGHVRMANDRPTGFTLYDTVSGDAHCVQVSGGELVRVAGNCE